MRELNHCFPLAGRYPATSMASEYIMVTWETNLITMNLPPSSSFPSAITVEHNTMYYEISLNWEKEKEKKKAKTNIDTTQTLFSNS